jgi:perosamine synthetase
MIPVAGPSITAREISYVTDAVTNGWYQNANSYIDRFEAGFKNYLGRKYAISLPSCTSALHLSLMALGIGEGDEVIVPDATWIASCAPVTYVGATPIFADIDPVTWCISPESVKKLITKRTKAIIAVNLYGHMPRYEELVSLGIPVIEDAAESIGSSYKNILAGKFGVTACFSFHGSKTMTTGEGGMLVTDSDEIYKRCMIIRDHGRLPGDTLFQNIEVGHKYKMSNLQAAIGLAQLERIEELVAGKRKIFNWYESEFEGCDYLSLNPAAAEVVNSYWMTTAIFKQLKMKKTDLVVSLAKEGVATRPFFDPLTSLKAYDNYSDSERAKVENINSYTISSRAVNLPSAASITREDLKLVRRAIEKIIL